MLLPSATLPHARRERRGSARLDSGARKDDSSSTRSHGITEREAYVAKTGRAEREGACGRIRDRAEQGPGYRPTFMAQRPVVGTPWSCLPFRRRHPERKPRGRASAVLHGTEL